ncbi:MAG: cytochrome c peroxidase, partial [Bacteroidota bacterium]
MWRILGLLLVFSSWLVLSNLNTTADEAMPINPVFEPVDFAGILYPEDNPTTAAGLDLGKHLFYDSKLSADGMVSCASCHRPEL